MIQNLELCVTGLLIISIMFHLFIDIIKKNKIITYPIQEEESIQVVYPQYIDCSRNIMHSLLSKDYLFTDGQLSEIH
ncbi:MULTISPECIES: hypothetical protein [unclassified Paenibacillus]|jgi:hypothetical protein|uniref:hypothetical protein n=1 Tax=unclassified Paenibacillus TaxID=185978 RepID=UPI00277F4391|nr:MULTISPECIES: hypothetical protein [unclassified Paenibacillus]MDQ0902247.1 hypothetical protein [Paenibacillus sp. V4I7]MDQ0919256.1 hypothetical protein [Paenibacillus sp. V4I5]